MKVLLPLLFSLISLVSGSQELPPFVNFDPGLYAGGNQNWMISQAADGNIYLANGMGLLEFTGEEWNLYPVPNNTIVRSVEAVDEKIFVGAYMEFGYWTRTALGTLEYTSLLPQLPEGLKDGEQVWHIESVSGFVVFQSFEGLYLYDLEQDRLKKVPQEPGNFISNLFEVEGQVYFQVAEKGLYSLQNGEAKLVIPTEILNDRILIHLFRQGKNLHFITEAGEFFRWKEPGLEQYYEDLSKEFEGMSIFSALALPNGEVVLGTVAQGLFQVSEGKLAHHFSQENGLLNNTVLTLFQDASRNLWAGLDHGISVIQLDSNASFFEDRNGLLGSVYCSYQSGDFLYIGTNQGLYFRKNGTQGFQLLPGTNGQVWSLQEIDGSLFCGHNSGTFVVEGSEARKISTRSGTWTVEKLREDIYIQGHYNGLSFLERNGKEFLELPLLPDFPHSSRYIVAGPDGQVWVNNEHKGVFRLQLDNSLKLTGEMRNYKFPEHTGITSSIFRFNDSLYYSSKEGILQYRPEQDSFVAQNRLAGTLKGLERVSGRIIKPGKDEIWGFEENSIFKVGQAQLKNGYRLSSIFLPKEVKAIPLGNENISRLQDGSYFLGVANGFVVFEEKPVPLEEYEVRIDRVGNWEVDKTPRLVPLREAGEFDSRSSNISFNFSVPEHQLFPEPLYSYRLLGQSGNWSSWARASSVSFENLRFGDYEFEVKALIGNRETPAEVFSFTVNRPWFLSWPAIGVYVLLFLLLLYIINKVNHKRHLKLNEEKERLLQMKHLEAEQEIIKLQNQQLEQNMAAKNKELAVSMMNLIQKNEILSRIREELREANAAQVKSVIRTIDREISEEDNWNFFKEAFTNADKDFFKKAKALHPELTANDLRLCAYLRLNLSSKEIAPLLNISVKSVEIKRYRLRKKMDLERNIQLADYILEI